MCRDAYIHLQVIGHVFGASGRSPGVLALDAVSFGVSKGEFLSILGPSGCGKTTLLRMIDGLINPTKGCDHLSRGSLRRIDQHSARCTWNRPPLSRDCQVLRS
ncbi:MAG: ATP-binding cassette domain-containing protein [Chloroflexi bacterium]|nr:ATP-binding cassette domain-containing protein [Chloroflexota bacterium]